MKDNIRITYLLKSRMFMMILLFMICLPVPAHASTIKISSKTIDRTSVKIGFKGSKDLKYWRIRRAVNTDDGMTRYKTVKILKRSSKSYVIRNLKKNTDYAFEITGGKKVKGKYKPLRYDYIWSHYTGMSTVCWDDYASSDAPCSPSCIELWGGCYNNGLPIKGYQIYRREKGGKYKKIKTIGKKGFPYKDNTVEPGKTYDYKFRSYGKYKKKTLYSPFSEVLTRSAINQYGTYTSTITSSGQDRVEFSLTSDKYNAALSFQRDHIHITNQEGESTDESGDYPLFEGLFQISRDGVTWETMDEDDTIQINGGETIYCAIESIRNKSLEEGQEPEDMTKIYQLEAYYASYDNLPVSFSFSLDGDGAIYYDMEAIH